MITQICDSCLADMGYDVIEQFRLSGDGELHVILVRAKYCDYCKENAMYHAQVREYESNIL